jgi:PII-like signaling protein
MAWLWTFGNVDELEGKEILRLVNEAPETIQIVDVRTQSEFVAGHIKGMTLKPSFVCFTFVRWVIEYTFKVRCIAR